MDDTALLDYHSGSFLPKKRLALESCKVQEAEQNIKEEQRGKKKFQSVCEALFRLLDAVEVRAIHYSVPQGERGLSRGC